MSRAAPPSPPPGPVLRGWNSTLNLWNGDTRTSSRHFRTVYRNSSRRKFEGYRRRDDGAVGEDGSVGEARSLRGVGGVGVGRRVSGLGGPGRGRSGAGRRPRPGHGAGVGGLTPKTLSSVRTTVLTNRKSQSVLPFV